MVAKLHHNAHSLSCEVIQAPFRITFLSLSRAAPVTSTALKGSTMLGLSSQNFRDTPATSKPEQGRSDKKLAELL